MKKFIQVLILTALLYFFMIALASAQAINSHDRIIFLDGAVKEGKVTALTADKVKFIHCDETLDYEFNKKEIDRIEFASGRTESMSSKKIIKPVDPIITKNRVAVLPMQYIADGSTERSIYMRTHLQETAISFLNKSAAELRFIDAVEINAALYKNDITEENISRYTLKELAGLLQVEYVIIGTVMQDKGKILTIVNQNKVKKETVKRNPNELKVSGFSNKHGTEVTKQDTETQVTLSIYSESGKKIYDNSRHSLLTDADAYKNTIKYMLKRTPLYKR